MLQARPSLGSTLPPTPITSTHPSTAPPVCPCAVAGHADSVCVGYPEACPAPNCTAPLNPAANFTFELIQGVLTEWAAIFPSQYMHLGGDEVDTSCWSESATISAWMTSQGYSPYNAYEYFVLRADAISRYVRTCTPEAACRSNLATDGHCSVRIANVSIAGPSARARCDGRRSGTLSVSSLLWPLVLIDAGPLSGGMYRCRCGRH